MQQFDDASNIKSSRRCFIVTDNEDPSFGNSQQRTAAKTNAEELVNKNVIIEPAFLSHGDSKGEGSNFDMSQFWDSITFTKPMDDEENADVEPVPSSYLVSDLTLKTSLLSRRSPKRALFTNRIELAPGIEIGVKGYLTFSKQLFVKDRYVYTQGEEKQIVKSEVKITDDESVNTVSPDEIIRAYEFGDSYIYFTPEQVNQIRNLGRPLIRIIGFKSPSFVPPEYNKRHSMFVYPSDSKLTGSIRAFHSLYQCMRQKGKVAIAWAIIRSNSIPEPCALFPVNEEVETKGSLTVQVTPPGFQLVILPYADDIRARPMSTITEGKAERIYNSFNRNKLTINSPK
ncbi:Yku70p [Sugiyamaella lignohabitans]|uniref:DNA helicase n=1 Tax=Sugiyamaella lignohabitans TaxID=796027 RepID=A0A167C337_9ASCO|nr:Yku70p [Sugiyamaella lignohabitans]ANB11160.1 Yku70p [Sugiyamaella lignohabitans]